MFGAPQLYQINHLPTSRYFLEAGKLPCNKSLLGLIFFQVRIWCHCLSCFSAALLGNRAHFGGSEEKTKPKLFGHLPEEPKAWVLLINGSNCRHSSTGGSAHCPVRLANNFGRRDRQELRQWVGTQTEVALMVITGWVTPLKSKSLRNVGGVNLARPHP